jgi:hypothetical protein
MYAYMYSTVNIALGLPLVAKFWQDLPIKGIVT